MSLLNLFRRDADAPQATRDRKSRRARVGMEALEGRQVLSVTYGSFLDMQYKFDYKPETNSATLFFENQTGSKRIFLTDQSNNDDINPRVNGINWVDQATSQQGGVDFAPGTRVQVYIITNNYRQNTFVNATSNPMQSVQYFDTNTPSGGTIDGLNYSWTNNQATGGKTFTITSAPGSQTYTIQQDTTYQPATGSVKSTSNLVLVRNDGARFAGPKLSPMTRVNFVVNQERAPNDSRRLDKTDPMFYQPQDRTITTRLDYGTGAGGTMSYRERLVHNRGQWLGMKYDLVTDPVSGTATLFWVNARGTRRISLNKMFDGNDGTQRVIGISWAEQGTSQGGGVNFRSLGQDLSKVSIVMVEAATGDNTFVNNSGWSLTRRTRTL
jgi:hypothetical protein